MDIKPKQIAIRDLFADYVDNDEEGVVGYHGKLDIRPQYQREFVYKDKQRNAVIESILKGYPLNVMYWVEKDNGAYELLDGQQRTISICQYLNNDFSVNEKKFHTQPKDIQEKILDYQLSVYFCNGTDSEKLDWFEVINFAGEKLNSQEIKNSIYSGAWLTDAKRYFSRRNCQAHNIAGDYLAGSAIRQDYLEATLDWISNGKIAEYMTQHQEDKDAQELWNYFNRVIAWVKDNFIEYREIMQGVAWGKIYNENKDKKFNPKELENKIKNLLLFDDEIQNAKGIYQYIFDKKESHLNLRAFSKTQKAKAFEKQAGKCPACKKFFKNHEMEADHKKPWHLGGKTIQENCQVMCRDCNREKSGK